MGCNSSTETIIDQNHQKTQKVNLNRLIEGINFFNARQNQPQNYKQSQPQKSNDDKKSQSAKKLQQIPFKQLIVNLRQKYHRFYKNIEDGMENPNFEFLKKQIRKIYVDIIRQTILQANDHRLSILESRIEISQHAVEVQIQCLKYVMKNCDIQIGIQFYKSMARFLKQLTGYLELKYPRGQVFDSAELTKMIKQINATQDFQYDILKNAGICFNSTDIVEITKTIKLFINKILVQLQKVFPRFKNLIEHLFDPQHHSLLTEQKINNNYKTQENLLPDMMNQHSQRQHKEKSGLTQTKKKKNLQKNSKNLTITQKMNEECKTCKKNIEISQNRSVQKITQTIYKDHAPKSSKTSKQQSIKPSYKIGRKISQNTSKYTRLQTGTLQIKHPQIQRVLIKWLQNLNQIIQKPQQFINFKNQYKFYSKQKGQAKLQFTKCSEDDFEKLIENGLIEKVQEKGLYQKNKIQQIKQSYNKFNMNLIDIFNSVNHSQHQVSTQQMQIIKFSHFNTDFISWMVEEDLIHAIKALVEVGQQVKQSKDSANCLDLIKFKVNDLMRCQFFGNKSKIRQIYRKFEQLDTEGKIVIIKIKNRFQTMLGDAMIFFKLPQSFIICQCQLVLQNEGKTEQNKKAKIVTDINHFLYQLERSPFGVLGQLCVFLKSKSQTVSKYCDKINLTRVESQINCKRNHMLTQKEKYNKQIKSAQYQQTEPFVCNKCIKFYPKYSNLNRVFQNCSQCLIKICNACSQKDSIIDFKQKLKQLGEYHQKKIYQEQQKNKGRNKNKKQQNKKQTQINNNNNDNLQNSQQKDNSQQKNNNLQQKNVQQKNYNIDLSKVFKNKYKKVKQLFCKKKQQTKIKVQTIINYLQQLYENQIKKNEKIMFIIGSWKKQKLYLKLYDYNPIKNSIVNAYQELQKYEKHQFITVNDNDYFLQIRSYQKKKINKQIKQQQFFQNGIYLFDDGQDKNLMLKTYQTLIRQTKDKQTNENYIAYFKFQSDNKNKFLILDFHISTKAAKSQGWVYQYLEELPNLTVFRKNIKLNNQGVQTKQLDCFDPQKRPQIFVKINKNKSSQNINQMNKKDYTIKTTSIKYVDNLTWLSSVKILNLSQNRINNIQIILENCLLLQQLKIYQNKITKLEFPTQLKQLNNLEASNNQIGYVKYLINLPKIQNIQLDNNKIANISFALQTTDKYKEDKKNQEKSSSVIKNYNSQSPPKNTQINKNKGPNFNSLTNKQQLKNNQKQNQQKTVKQRKVIKSLIKLNLQQNQLKEIQNITQVDFPNLQYFNISHNKLTKLPKLRMPQLKQLLANNNKLTEVDDNLNLNDLQVLYLNNNQFKNLSSFKNMPRLKILYLSDNQILSLNSWADKPYPNLIKFQIKHNLLTQIPKFNTQQIQKIDFSFNKITNIGQFISGQYQKLVLLNLNHNQLGSIPKLNNFKKLQKLDLQNNQILINQKTPINQVQSISIKQVNLSYNRISQLPIFKTRQLQKISLKQNPLKYIKNFANQQFPRLKLIEISHPKANKKMQSNIKDIYQEFFKQQSKREGKKSEEYKYIKMSINRHRNVGFFLLKQKNYDLSLQYYQKALKLVQKINKNSKQCLDYAVINIDIARLYKSRSQDQKQQASLKSQRKSNAWKYYSQGLKIIQTICKKKNYNSTQYILQQISNLNNDNKLNQNLNQQKIKQKKQEKQLRSKSDVIHFYYAQFLVEKANFIIDFKKDQNPDFNNDFTKEDWELIKKQNLKDLLLQAQQKLQKTKKIDFFQLGKIHYIMGDFYYSNDQLQLSVSYYQKCIKDFINSKVKNARTNRLYNIYFKCSQVYDLLGDYNKAIQYHENGLYLLKKKKGKLDKKYVQRLDKLIDLYEQRRMYTEAINYSKKYCDIIQLKINKVNQKKKQKKNTKPVNETLQSNLENQNQNLNDDQQDNQQQTIEDIQELYKQKIKAYQKIAYLNSQQKNYDESITYYINILKFNIQRQQRQKNLQKKLQSTDQKNQQEIKNFYTIQQILQLANSIKFNPLEQQQIYFYNILTYINIAQVCKEKNQSQKSLRIYQKCINMINIIKDQNESSQKRSFVIYILNNTAEIYKEKKLFFKALQIYQNALNLEYNQKYKSYNWDFYRSKIKLANQYMKFRQFQKAYKHFSQGQQQFQQYTSYDQLYQITINMAQCLFNLNQYQNAFTLLKKCEDQIQQTFWDQNRRNILISKIYQKLGQISFRNGKKIKNQTQLKNAIQYFMDSLEIIQQTNGSQCIQSFTTLVSLSSVLIQKRNFQAAKQYINKAKRILNLEQTNDKNIIQKFSFENSILFLNQGQIQKTNHKPNYTEVVKSFREAKQYYKKYYKYISLYLNSKDIYNQQIKGQKQKSNDVPLNQYAQFFNYNPSKKPQEGPFKVKFQQNQNFYLELLVRLSFCQYQLNNTDNVSKLVKQAEEIINNQQYNQQNIKTKNPFLQEINMIKGKAKEKEKKKQEKSRYQKQKYQKQKQKKQKQKKQRQKKQAASTIKSSDNLSPDKKKQQEKSRRK